MAKLQVSKNNYAPRNRRKKRPGVHSKCRTSKLKASKLYRKSYRGQG